MGYAEDVRRERAEAMVKFKGLLRLVAIGVAALFVAIWALAGFTHVDAGEVTVLIKNLGSNTGMQKDVLTIGTHWVEPFTYDTATYDTKVQQQGEIKDLPGASSDGQPVTIDFSLQTGLNPLLVPLLHSQVGPNYYDSIVYPALRSVVRDDVASQSSAELFTAAGRKAVENLVNADLQRKFARYGVLAEINLREIVFLNKEYITVLESKAKAAQQVEIETRLAQAAVQKAIGVANDAEGAKQSRIKAAEAQREESRLGGEGERLKQEETAKGILAIATAEARGTALRREALSGLGGKELVSIEWAHSMGPNIKVYGFPTGAPGTSSIMDLNGIMQGAFKGGN